jgi:hypothetical protein
MVREPALQCPLQAALIGQPHGPLCCRSAPVPLPADFQLAGTGLSQPLHRQPQHFILDLDVEHSPDHIPFRRP